MSEEVIKKIVGKDVVVDYVQGKRLELILPISKKIVIVPVKTVDDDHLDVGLFVNIEGHVFEVRQHDGDVYLIDIESEVELFKGWFRLEFVNGLIKVVAESGENDN